jgi:hypothetical protein
VVSAKESPLPQHNLPMEGALVERNLRILTMLGWITAVFYVAVALFEVLIDSDEALGTRIGFPVFLVALAVALMVGIRLTAPRPTLGAIVASVSALVGAFVLFWTLLAIVLGVAIVFFSVLTARHSPTAEAVA